MTAARDLNNCLFLAKNHWRISRGDLASNTKSALSIQAPWVDGAVNRESHCVLLTTLYGSNWKASKRLNKSRHLWLINTVLSQAKLSILVASKCVHMTLNSRHSTMVYAAGKLGHIDIPCTLLGHGYESSTCLYAELVGQVAAPHHHLGLAIGYRIHWLSYISGGLFDGWTARQGAPGGTLATTPKGSSQGWSLITDRGLAAWPWLPLIVASLATFYHSNGFWCIDLHFASWALLGLYLNHWDSSTEADLATLAITATFRLLSPLVCLIQSFHHRLLLRNHVFRRYWRNGAFVQVEIRRCCTL